MRGNPFESRGLAYILDNPLVRRLAVPQMGIRLYQCHHV